MQFCWVFQSPCFISKITFCNTDSCFDSKIAVFTTPVNNQFYEQARLHEMLL